MKEQLYPKLGELLEQAEQDRGGVRQDSAREDLGIIFQLIRDQSDGIFDSGFLEESLLAIWLDTDKLQQREHQKQMKSLFGLPVILPEPWKQTLMEGFIKDNVSMVKSLNADEVIALEGVVSGGIRRGLKVEDIRREISKKLDVDKNRAAFIARDQVGKLFGELSQHRQQGVGIKEYTWSTSNDERVRPAHRELNDTVQSWDKPPVVEPKTQRRAHPGQDFQCRCQPIPVLPKEFQ